mgnify:CR=1 FL=1
MFEDSFVIVDLETTGLSPKNGEIIEIGAIKVINIFKAIKTNNMVYY